MNLWSLCPVDFCDFEFMQKALTAAALVGVSAPAIGIFLVQRRLSLMGDGIGHVAFTGVAAGLLFGIFPLYTAIAAAIVGAIVLELLRERGRAAGDVALAVIFYGGIAGAALLLSLAETSTATTLGYLFGQVLSVNESDLVVAVVVATGVLVITLALRKTMFAVTYDEEVARAAGVPVRALNILIAVTAAVAIGLTMRVVGILLVSAMLVLPVATVQQITRSFNSTFVAAVLLGGAIGVAGMIGAYYLDAAPGGTIVVGAIMAFLMATVFARLREVR